MGHKIKYKSNSHHSCGCFPTAFHILKDTTIQFTLEKLPIDEDSQFTYLDLDEPYQSSGLLRVEGKFVNPVQVTPCTWYDCT